LEAGDEVGPAEFLFQDLRADAAFFEEAGQHGRGPGFVSWRVGGVGAQKVLEQAVRALGGFSHGSIIRIFQLVMGFVSPRKNSLATLRL